MTLHELCLTSLNHEITQALACSKRLERSDFSQALASLGLLHFFVVSGAHLTLILNFFNIFERSRVSFLFKHLSLLTFVVMCNGSPPILRVFLSYFFKTSSQSLHLHVPSLINNFVSYVFCLALFSSSKFLIFSTNLSFTFWLMVFMSSSPRFLHSTVRLYFLSIPFLIFIFGVPHYSSLAVAPVTAIIVSFLLPTSLLALVYFRAEIIAVETWWFFKDFVDYVTIFFNFPQKFQLEYNYISSQNFILFNLFNFFIIYAGIIVWRRKSYSFV